MSDKVFDELASLLAKEIPIELAEMNLKKKLFCVRVYYFDTHAPSGYIMLRAIYDSDRKKEFRENEENPHYILWSPGEMFGNGPDLDIGGEHEPEFRSEELLQQVYRLLGKSEKRYMPKYRAALGTACQSLNRKKWSKSFSVADDFCFVTADGSYFFDDPWQDFALSLTTKQLIDFQSAELIGTPDSPFCPESLQVELDTSDVDSLEEMLEEMTVKQQMEFWFQQLDAFVNGESNVMSKFKVVGSFAIRYMMELGNQTLVQLLEWANRFSQKPSWTGKGRSAKEAGHTEILLKLFWAIADSGYSNRKMETLLKRYVADSFTFNQSAKSASTLTYHAANCLNRINKSKYPKARMAGSNHLENYDEFGL